MNIQTTKIELIKEIADIQNEQLLQKLRQFLRRENKTDSSKPKKSISFNKEESALLLKINEGLPEQIQQRYNNLNQKLLRKNITESELSELQNLIPQVEAHNGERLSNLIQLAKLWETSVDEVMARLKIEQPEVIHG